MKLLTVSIVVYQLDERLLKSVLDSLSTSILQADMTEQTQIVLVDNGGNQKELRHSMVENHLSCIKPTILQQEQNRGFGAGHNAVLKAHPGQFHLILNPDVLLGKNTISLAMKHFETHEETILICPNDRREQPTSISQ